MSWMSLAGEHFVVLRYFVCVKKSLMNNYTTEQLCRVDIFTIRGCNCESSHTHSTAYTCKTNMHKPAKFDA